jgi:hypothetical protein
MAFSDLDFQSMIGGPLDAVIHAQAQSAQTSVDFIKSVGFDESNKPTMITFSYMKAVESEEGKAAPPAKYDLTVPILTMLPIPFIRVKETTIDFNAKITALEETKSEASKDLNITAEAKARWSPVSVKLKASYSYKSSTSASASKEQTYSMNVHVLAVQDEMPAGTERLLGILENAIEEVPSQSK